MQKNSPQTKKERKREDDWEVSAINCNYALCVTPPFIKFRVLSIENEVLITRFGERGMMGTAIVAAFPANHIMCFPGDQFSYVSKKVGGGFYGS